MNTNNATPAIDPGTQTREQRFWLLDNGFNLARDLTGTVWLYTFKVQGVQHCVGFFDGSWSVYRCGSTRTVVVSRGDSFRAVLAQSLRLMAA